MKLCEKCQLHEMNLRRMKRRGIKCNPEMCPMLVCCSLPFTLLLRESSVTFRGQLILKFIQWNFSMIETIIII